MYGFVNENHHENASINYSAIAYKDPITHAFVIIIIIQSIKIDGMFNILVCPVQCCIHNTFVSKCPKFLSHHPTEDNHALILHDPNGCSPLLTIPLSLDNVTSYFKGKCSSLAEYEDDTIPKYHLMSKHPPRDPSTMLYSSKAHDMISYRGQINVKSLTDPASPDLTVSSVVLVAYTAVKVTENYYFATAL